MDFVEKNLRENEKIVARAQISIMPLIPSCIVALVILIIGAIAKFFVWAFIFDVIYLAVQYFRIRSNVLAITDKKFIGKTGVFRVAALEAPLEKVDSMTVIEPFFGKIFNYATLQINTASARIGFQYVQDAIQFKNQLLDSIDAKNGNNSASVDQQ